MGIFDKPKKTAIESRRYQEKLYEVALEEFENSEIRKGLYAKALSMADGNKEKAEGIYLKLRVKSIMDDIESEQINRREDARAYEALQELRDIEHRKGLVDSESIKTKNWTNSLHYQCIEVETLSLHGSAIIDIDEQIIYLCGCLRDAQVQFL